MGYGGGDGGGGGGFTTIEFPDGSVGSYIEDKSNITGEDGTSSSQGFRALDYTAWQIHNFPDKFFSEYVHTAGDGDWIFSDSRNSNVSVNVLDIEDIDYVNDGSVTIHWKTSEKTFGFKVTNNSYLSEIGQNFPFVLASGFESLTNYTGVPGSSGIHAEILETKVPVLYMLYSDRLDTVVSEDYNNIGSVDIPQTEYLDKSLEHPEGVIEYFTKSTSEPIRISSAIDDVRGVMTSELISKYDFSLSQVGLKMSRTYNFANLFSNYTCDFDGPIEEDIRKTNRYSIAKAINNSISETFYESQSDISIHIQLWDIYYASYGSGYGGVDPICHHIIDSEGTEWWIFSKGNGNGPNGSYNYNFSYWDGDTLTKGGDSLCPLFFDELRPTHSYDGAVIGLEMNATAVEEAAVYFNYLDDTMNFPSSLRTPDFTDPHVLVYDSDDAAESVAMTIAFGINVEQFVSTLITTDHSFAQIAPTKKKRLWDWHHARTGITEWEGLYKNDGYYGGNELIRYAAYSVRAPYIPGSSTRPAVGDSITFGIDAYADDPYTLGDYVGSGGGGGGSDLPDLASNDLGKSLRAVYKNSEYVWDKATAPVIFGGNVDDGVGMNSWNNTEHDNFILLGNGIHAEYEALQGQNYLRLYGKASELNVGNCIDISSAKTGGFSVNKSTTDGVTTYALDISDIDKFQQLVAGTGIQISKSIDANNVRSYTIEATSQYNHLATNLNEAFKNNVHIESGAWRTLNTYAGGGSYHPSYWQLDTDSVYYIDVGLSFEVPANIAAGSYARLILSPYSDGDPTNVDKVLYSNQGEMSNIGRSSIFEDTKLLIPGVVNTLHFSGIVSIGSNSINNQLYFNMYHNAGVSLGYDTASGTPTVQLPIKLSGFAFKC
jgi:hypothetical protein